MHRLGWKIGIDGIIVSEAKVYTSIKVIEIEWNCSKFSVSGCEWVKLNG